MEEAIITSAFLIFTYLIIFRYYHLSFIISLVFAAPMLLFSFLLLVVFQTLSWLNKNWFSRKKFQLNRVHRLVAKGNTITLEALEQFYRDYNEAIIALTGEEKMGIQVEKPGTPRKYVPKDQRDEDEPARFVMQKLKAKKKAKIRDGMVGLSDDGSVNRFRNNEVALTLVLAQLNGWENIKDGDEEVDFNPKDKEGSFDMLPDEIQDELIDEFGSVGVQQNQEEDEGVDVNEDEDEEGDDLMDL